MKLEGADFLSKLEFLHKSQRCSDDIEWDSWKPATSIAALSYQAQRSFQIHTEDKADTAVEKQALCLSLLSKFQKCYH